MIENPSKFKLVKERAGELYMYSYLVEDASYSVYFEILQNNIYTLKFILHSHAGTTHITSKVTDVGTDISIGVFSTLIEVMKHFVYTYKPSGLEFIAEESPGETRSNLYTAMLKKYLPKYLPEGSYKLSTVFKLTLN